MAAAACDVNTAYELSMRLVMTYVCDSLWRGKHAHVSQGPEIFPRPSRNTTVLTIVQIAWMNGKHLRLPQRANDQIDAREFFHDTEDEHGVKDGQEE